MLALLLLCFAVLLLCSASSASLCCCCCCFKNKRKDRRYTKVKTCGASKQHKQRTTRTSRAQAHDNCSMIATREGGHQWYGPCHTRTAARAPDRIPRLQPLAINDNGLHTQPAAQHSSAVQSMQLPKVPGIIFTERYYCYYYLPICPEI